MLIKHKPRIILCLDEDAIKDGVEIYEMLSSLGLDVYFIDLKGKGDISYQYETNGENAIKDLLKTKRKIDFLFQIYNILS
jgi:hypothetical protein